MVTSNTEPFCNLSLCYITANYLRPSITNTLNTSHRLAYTAKDDVRMPGFNNMPEFLSILKLIQHNIQIVNKVQTSL